MRWARADRAVFVCRQFPFYFEKCGFQLQLSAAVSASGYSSHVFFLRVFKGAESARALAIDCDQILARAASLADVSVHDVVHVAESGRFRSLKSHRDECVRRAPAINFQVCQVMQRALAF